jgi:hypothetical protein
VSHPTRRLEAPGRTGLCQRGAVPTLRRAWTLAQANNHLPKLTSLLSSVRAAVERDAGRDDAFEGGDPRLLLPGIVDLLSIDGIVLRDLDPGLIDFPARTSEGRDYWLCWVLGETEVGFWHWPEDGFAGRTPVSELPT